MLTYTVVLEVLIFAQAFIYVTYMRVCALKVLARLDAQSSLSICCSYVLTKYILNKSENATPELFAIYIQNYANQECNGKCF